MRRAGGYGIKVQTSAEAMVRLKVDLANMPDDRLFAATVESLAPRYRVKARELECVLLASQDSRRRFLAEQEKQAICREFGNGAAANRNGEPRASNPHRPSDPLYDAWASGWDEEEGPAFKVAAQ
jgi:hypothetical protein